MPPSTLKLKPGLFLSLLFLIAVAFAAGGMRGPGDPGTAPPAARVDPPAARPTDPAAARDSVIGGAPAGDGAAREADLRRLETQWWQELTYPTGRLPDWVPAAIQQDRRIATGIPAGRVVYDRQRNPSPLVLDPAQFTSLGPIGVQTNGCSGCYQFGIVAGRATDIAIDPLTPNVAYLATAGSGLWKTTNCCTAATTWALSTAQAGVTASSVDSIAIDPNNHTTLYVGTGELDFCGPCQSAYGLLKSTDAGDTWTLQGTEVFTPGVPIPPAGTYGFQSLGKVRVDPRNSNNVVVGTKTGLFFSYDAGADWSGPCFTNPFTTQRQQITGLILSPVGSSTMMYAAVGTATSGLNGANAVYSTTLPAAGCPAAWNLLSAGWPAGTGDGTPSNAKPGRIDLAQAPSQPTTLYAQAENLATAGQLGVWQSTDGGATWTQRSGAGALGGCGFDYVQNFYDQGLAVDPHNPLVLFMDTYDIWKSTDGGATFLDVTCGYNGAGPHPVHVDQHALQYVPGSSSTLLAVNDGGVYSTLNADFVPPALPVWNNLNTALPTLQFYSGNTTGGFANSSAPAANGGLQDNGSAVTTWSGSPSPQRWQEAEGGDGFYARIEPTQNQRWYEGSNAGHIFLSASGASGPWVDVTGGWTADPQSFQLPYEIAQAQCGGLCTYLLVGTNRVWETVTGGLTPTSWYANSGQLSRGAGGYILQIAYAPADPTVAVAGTLDGYVQYGYNLGQGVPGSATWVNISAGNTVLPNRAINDVALDPLSVLVGYAAAGSFDANTPAQPGHVFQFTCTPGCASVTWLDKTGNLPDIPAYSIMVNPLYHEQAFVGTEWGLFYTNDITVASPTWLRFEAGLPRVLIWDLTTDGGDTVLAAWTHGRGAFVWPLPAGPFPPLSPTPTATRTAVPPTASATVLPPTVTAGPPTASATVLPPTPTTGPPTDTPRPTVAPPTATPAPPTSTPGPTAPPCQVRFSDVRPTDYFYAPVQYLACQGVISGYADGTFRPYADTTRAQMVKIVVLGFGVPLVTPADGPSFADVPASQPFFSVIETAATHNIVSGYTCGGPGEPCDAQNRPYFRPNARVTRGQLAKIDVVTAGWPPTSPSVGTFADVAPGSAFYAFVETAVRYGVLSGYTCGGAGEPCDPQNRPYFRQYGNATRGQIAKIVYLSLPRSSHSQGR